MITFRFFRCRNWIRIFLFSKRVQMLKTEYKYGQYCTPLSQSDCRYFFVLAIITRYFPFPWKPPCPFEEPPPLPHVLNTCGKPWFGVCMIVWTHANPCSRFFLPPCRFYPFVWVSMAFKQVYKISNNRMPIKQVRSVNT